MTIRYTQPMRDVPSEERPRERLLRYGAEALATHELIAILLRTGTTKRHVLGVAEDLLAQLGGLRGVATAGVEELSRVEGVGRTKAIEICAAVELGKRIGTLTEEARPTIRGPDDVVHLLMPELRYLKQEELRAVLLDRRHRVIHVAKISRGSLTESISHPRDIFRAAIERVSQFSDERSRAIKIRFADDEATIHSSLSESGESEESLAVDYGGPTTEIGFNATYLLEFLRAVGEPRVRFHFKDPQSAGELTPAGEDLNYRYRYVVMPMRI